MIDMVSFKTPNRCDAWKCAGRWRVCGFGGLHTLLGIDSLYLRLNWKQSRLSWGGEQETPKLVADKEHPLFWVMETVWTHMMLWMTKITFFKAWRKTQEVSSRGWFLRATVKEPNVTVTYILWTFLCPPLKTHKTQQSNFSNGISLVFFFSIHPSIFFRLPEVRSPRQQD